jgi:hypothetical protein
MRLAAIGDVREFDAGGRFQDFRDQVMRRADADAADPQFVGLGLGARHHLREAADAGGLAGAERIDAVAGEPDRLEVAQQIDVGLRLYRGIGGVGARGLQERMAVRLRLLYPDRADAAGRTRHVLHHDRLSQKPFHAGLSDPHRPVGGSAGRERHDDLDRLCGEALRDSSARQRQ